MEKKDFGLYSVFILIIASAFFLRLYHLDERVFHHDEAAVGYFTYKLFNDNVYSYDPAFHGPFIYYATAEMFRRLGDTIYSARLLPALLGASIIFFLIPLRKYIGKTGLVISAFFFAFSPSFLYYSRFYREDIFISFFTLLMLVCVIKYAEKYIDVRRSIIKVSHLLLGTLLLISAVVFYTILPASSAAIKENAINAIFLALIILLLLLLATLILIKYGEKHIEYGYSIFRPFYLFLAGVSLASMAALKENAYIAMGLILLFLFLFFIRERWYSGLFSKIRKLDKKVLIVAVEGVFFIIVVLVVYSLFYTGKVFDLYGMKVAFIKAVSHWVEMHRIERIGGPMYFYLPIMALYELPVFVFGFAGIIHYYKKNDILMTFLGYWTITNLIIYSYLQEKVPWLILNPLLPLVIIAGAYLGELLPRLRFDTRVGAFVIIFLVASSSYSVYSSMFLNYYDYTNPAEPLIQAAQPPQKYSLFISKISEISRQYSNQSTEIQVTDPEMETQFLWYLRHYGNVRWKVSINSELNAPLIVVHDSDGNESDATVVKRHLRTDYERLDSAKMSWYWFQPSDVTPGYLLTRKMDRAPGEYRIVLFYKPKK